MKKNTHIINLIFKKYWDVFLLYQEQGSKIKD